MTLRVWVDGHDRAFEYVRLSLTEACNYSCTYCLPHGYQHTKQAPPPLSPPEIRRLCAALLTLSVKKLRLTGGEPTLRSDFSEILHAVQGVPELAISTNGYRLQSLVPALTQHRVTAVNVSLDSLSPERFAAITKVGKFHDVWAGITAAQSAGLRVKLNCVWTRDTAQEDLPAFMNLVASKDLEVRFIELMPTGVNRAWFDTHRATTGGLVERLGREGYLELARPARAGPARVFQRPGDLGRIGVIAPYAKDFCATCNRLRITAQGGLRLCLFGDGAVPLRQWLQRDEQREELCAQMRAALQHKPQTHPLALGRYGDLKTFAQLGG